MIMMASTHRCLRMGEMLLVSRMMMAAKEELMGQVRKCVLTYRLKVITMEPCILE